MQRLKVCSCLRAIASRSTTRSWHCRFYGTLDASSPSPTPAPPRPPRKAHDHLVHGVHAFECPDQVGITAKITECIASRGASILGFDVYTNFDVVKHPVYFARTEFVFDPSEWPRNIMDEDFLKLKQAFNAEHSIARVLDIDPPLRIAVLVSWKDHCVMDLLYRWQEGKLPVQIMCIISNHMREEDTNIIRFLARHKIPYHYVAADKDDRKEEEILRLTADTDFLVLAHYMQILSPQFLRAYGKDLINIHHGLLPSFKGANPYKQAYEAGVKLIGATSHFVTEELDGGPIIEQMVERVTHRDSLSSFALKSEYLERICLGKAVKYYCELRIMRYGGNRTVVFD